MKSETTTFRLAFFQKANGPLSKTIVLDDRGVPESDGSDCKMSSGTACNTSFQGLSGLGELISAMKTETALALGTVLDRADHDSVQITTKGRVETSDGAIARSKSYIGFEPGQPGLLLIDFDQKGMPDDVAQRLAQTGDVWEALCKTCPDLVNAGILRRASTSAGLYNAETNERYEGSGGEHIYVAVKDASDIPRATQVLHMRLWLAGFGWIRLGVVGQKLERSIVDQSVGSPERLVFEGAPVVVPPIEQSAEARRPIVIEGDVIDTRVSIPNLTAQERARFGALVAEMKRQLEPEAVELRDRADDRLSKKLAEETGMELDQAKKQIARRHYGELLPLHPLQFDERSLGEVTVGDVLADPERFVEQTLADPLEGVSYGRNKAKAFQRRDGSLWINSFAHGGGTYELKHDGISLRALVERMPGSVTVDEFISALANSILDAGEEKVLLDAAKDATRINIGDLRDRLEAARRVVAARERNDAERPDVGDGRTWLPAPAEKAELMPTLAGVDQVLRAVEAVVPPFRTFDHKLAKVTRRPVTQLHQLASDGDEPQAAPPQATIKAANDAEATILIEEHVGLLGRDRVGNEVAVRLQLPFVRAYASWEESALPRVNGIATIPMVLPNRELKSGIGLDRELNLIFDVERELQATLEDLDLVSLDEATKAFQWLCDEWLSDVDTDIAGKAIIIAMALTIIERHLLPQKPAFFVTAAQRGSGKTTALNMVSTAVTGSMASAASWSFDDEERRKGVFSYLREGAAMVIYDNVPRGSSLSCPTIERVLTSPELDDRVLGESRSETAPTSTVIAFTGNNISPKGDMASRSLVVQLSSDRTDPENRDFVHDDPITWTEAHRFEILRHLFMILVLDRAKPNRAKTRFKRWWELIGHPIELVSGVDFDELFRTNDQFDEEAQGATEFIAMMVKHLDGIGSNDRKFTAAEVTKLVDDHLYGKGVRPADPNTPDPGTLKSALEDASGRPFSGGIVNARRVAHKLKSIEGRPVQVEGVLMHLVVEKDHEANAYRIERI